MGKSGIAVAERSALVEAIEQLTRALDLIAELPGTQALRRQQIRLQVALITPLLHVKGYAAPEAKAAAQRARALIERAHALDEPPDDPLLLFSALYGYWTAIFTAFNGDVARELASQFLMLAEKQGTTVPLLVAHRIMGSTLLCSGKIAEGRAHFDKGIALYDPVNHRTLATRFGVDSAVVMLCWGSLALWMLGYPKAALADSARGLSDAREIGHASTLLYALGFASPTLIHSGNYATANLLLEELVGLADEKGSAFWKAFGMVFQGCVLALTHKASEAVQAITAGIAAWKSTGATVFMPWFLSVLTRAHAELGQIDDARYCIGEAMAAIETSRESWYEAELNRVAGKIALKLPEPDSAKAQAYFERALAVARQQQAKSWELRAAMSMARLWRDQGKPQRARELLAPVYGWFTEGFETLDLKEAKKLLDELAS